MAIDYTVIDAVRQHFGDSPVEAPGVAGEDRHEMMGPGAAGTFVGVEKQFPFDCPNVDPSQWAVLQMLTMGVSSNDNVIEVNGEFVPGGLSWGPVFSDIDPHVPLWKTETLLVPPGVLRVQNILYVASAADGGGNYDDFAIDNVVIWFKTKDDRVPVPTPPIEGAAG